MHRNTCIAYISGCVCNYTVEYAGPSSIAGLGMVTIKRRIPDVSGLILTPGTHRLVKARV